MVSAQRHYLLRCGDHWWRRIETGMIGKDGVFGAVQPLDDKVSLNHVVVQVAGIASIIARMINYFRGRIRLLDLDMIHQSACEREGDVRSHRRRICHSNEAGGKRSSRKARFVSPANRNKCGGILFVMGYFTPGEMKMKKIVYVLAAVAAVAIAAPAVAQDKPMMDKGDMHKGMMMHRHHHMMMHHRMMRHRMHHMMKKDGM